VANNWNKCRILARANKACFATKSSFPSNTARFAIARIQSSTAIYSTIFTVGLNFGLEWVVSKRIPALASRNDNILHPRTHSYCMHDLRNARVPFVPLVPQ
jgi:hypothetical protein